MIILLLLLLTVQVPKVAMANNLRDSSSTAEGVPCASSGTRRVQTNGFSVASCLGSLTAAAGIDGLLTSNELIAFANTYRVTKYNIFGELPVQLIAHFNELALVKNTNGENVIDLATIPPGQVQQLCQYLDELFVYQVPSSAPSETPTYTPSIYVRASSSETVALFANFATNNGGWSLGNKIGVAIASMACVIVLAIFVNAYWTKVKVGPVIASTSGFHYRMNNWRRYWNESILRYYRVTVTNKSSGHLQMFLFEKDLLQRNKAFPERIGGGKGASLRPLMSNEPCNPFTDFHVRGDVHLTVASRISPNYLPFDDFDKMYGGNHGLLVLKKNEQHCWHNNKISAATKSGSRMKEWVINDTVVDTDDEYEFVPFEDDAIRTWHKYIKKMEGEINRSDQKFVVDE